MDAILPDVAESCQFMESHFSVPGEMLREQFMVDYGLTASTLAAALGVSHQKIHELLREQHAVTPLMALRLARLFGNSPTFWLNA